MANRYLETVSVENQKGFTLVGLTVVCSMLFLVVIGLYRLFDAGVLAYAFSDNQAEIQQNARAAIFRMSSDIKNARRITNGSASSSLALETPGGETRFYLNNGKLMRRINTGGVISEEEVAEMVNYLWFYDIKDNFVKIIIETGKGSNVYKVETAVYIPDKDG
ncbi:PilW family protein [Thermincola ferriacetica]